MSQSYRSFAARRLHSKDNRYGEEAEHSEAGGSSHSEYSGHGSSRGKGQRRPSWLKGKEIGLYYRDKAIEKAKQKKSMVMTLSKHVQEKIESVLLNSEGFYDALTVKEVCANNINSTLENKFVHIHDSQFKKKFLNILSGNIQENLANSVLTKFKLEKNVALDAELLDEFKMKQNSPEYANMLKFRTKLPSYKMKSEILKLIRENQIVVISGETGCGKTTQVAQFILDDQIERGNASITHIICTQPRRISAISVAERVAAERAEKLGTSVGFQVRLEKVMPRDCGSILYCTTGIMLQFLQTDPALTDFSHIILDEIHERSTQSDFILALLKFIIPKRPDLKVLLMSATLNSTRFSEYYDLCPIIDIPGFTYPVQEFYLEDVLSFTQFHFPVEPGLCQEYSRYNKKNIHMRKKKDRHMQKKKDEFNDIIEPYIRQLRAERKYPLGIISELQKQESEVLSLDLVKELIGYICSSQGPGAILIFLPGLMDIVKLHRMLLDSYRYAEDQYVIYPLHSRMPTIDQKQIFVEPPEGVRKIIIATSIAETSITIEDVVYVVDCGKTKFGKFDFHKNVEALEPEWVSLANAKQRKGRAGRVKPGICYHLYTRGREMTFDQYPVPEMLRTRLDEVILQIKILQLGKARDFLVKVMDPPNSKAIDLSLELLAQLNALDDDEDLTPLGYHLAQLPVDPRNGKMIILAALFSCVEPVFAIAASLSFKDAFYYPLGKEEQARRKKLELSLNQFSDHIAFSEALSRFERAYNRGCAGRFCNEFFLSFNTLRLLSDMKAQLAQHLYEMKFMESENPCDRSVNRNSTNMALVKAIVCAALYPNIAVIRNSTKNGTRGWTQEDGCVNIHPSSVNHKIDKYPSPYIMYFRKQRSTAIFLHDTTCVTIPILLFAAPNISLTKAKGIFVINLLGTRTSISCESKAAKLIQKLQENLKHLLQYKMTHPGTVAWNSSEGDLLNAVIDLVCVKDVDMKFSNIDPENSIMSGHSDEESS